MLPDTIRCSRNLAICGMIILSAALAPFFASANSEAHQQTNQKFKQAIAEKPARTRRPANAGLTEAEVEKHLKAALCQNDEIIVSPLALNEQRTESFDRLFACSSMCSVRGCTYHVYISDKNGRLRPAGLIDGICEAVPMSENGFRRIRCLSQSAEQKMENVWRFDGQHYR